jgi:hypothetical protein
LGFLKISNRCKGLEKFSAIAIPNAKASWYSIAIAKTNVNTERARDMPVHLTAGCVTHTKTAQSSLSYRFSH